MVERSGGELSMPPGSDADLAIAVVEVGAAIVRRRFGAALGRREKGPGDFATDADVEAERAMLALLRAERPSDVVLGEEMGRSGGEGGSRVWLIDPLCGTLNYAAGTRMVAVNAVLKAAGRSAAAAVADPFTGEIFWSDRGAAWVRVDGRDTALVPDATSALVDLNLDPPFPGSPGFRAAALAAWPGFAPRFRPRVLSTSLALTWVAAGRRAAYVTDGDMRDSVHFAAGLAICEAAGCTLTDLRGHAWGHGATGLVAAADFATHVALLDAIREQTADVRRSPSTDRPG
jgi:myo-inositol-1(or 4)-monophosphatase